MGREMTLSGRSPSPAEIVARWRRHPMLEQLLQRLDGGHAKISSIPDDLTAALPFVVDAARRDFNPLSDDQLSDQLLAVVAAIGIGASQNEKREWMTVATLQLSRFPAGLCREGLQEAVLNCERLNQVIKFVAGYCEDYPQRMAARLDRLERLLAISERNKSDV